MSVALYMDVHVRRAVTNGLRMRGVNVLTAQEDGAAKWPDDRLLDRAGKLWRVLFRQDDDLLTEAELRQRENLPFAGVIHDANHRLLKPCVKQCSRLAGISRSSSRR